MTEGPAEPFDDTISYGEALDRFAAIIRERLAALPLDERARFRRSTTQDWRWEPIDGTWLRLFGVLDDGELELGRVARAAFRREPPGLS